MLKKINAFSVVAGAVLGIAALILVIFGNPVNMGLCIACFVRDTTGALGMHSVANLQYFRPEIVGLILGAFTLATIRGEFKPKAGSSPFTRFVLGAIVMIGGLVFLGCPTRLFLRLGGGDANALVGLVGLIAGVYIGTRFLNRGFSLKRNYEMSKTEGGLMPIIIAAGLLLASLVPGLFKLSEAGPGSQYAPVLLALGLSFVVGMLVQRARLCTIGAVRDVIMFKDFTHFQGILAMFFAVLLGNVILDSFRFGFELQAIAHSNHIWNFLGMLLVGWACVLLGGCPMRQLILTGEGNSDGAVTIIGMVFGAAMAHNFGLAASPDSLTELNEVVVGGVSLNGQVAVAICLTFLVGISLTNLPKVVKAIQKNI